MVLTITIGKNAKLCVATSGTATTEVLGAQNVSIDAGWESKKIMHLRDSAKTTIMLLKNWTLTGTLTEDFADAGQDIIRTAYNAGSDIAFMLYPGTATATTTTFMCTTGKVTKYGPKFDPMNENNASFTIEENGVAMTMPA
jgi:hypothetical protein